MLLRIAIEAKLAVQPDQMCGSYKARSEFEIPKKIIKNNTRLKNQARSSCKEDKSEALRYSYIGKR